MKDDRVTTPGMEGMDVYNRPFLVRYSETGCDGLLKPLKVFDYLQDAAMEHAHRMGVSSAQLQARNLAWFVLRYHVRLFGFPRWNETVAVKTWRYPERNLYEIRRYEIRDAQANLFMEGVSSLVIIDTERKKPVRLKHALPPELLRTNVTHTHNFAEIPGVARPEFEQIFPIRKQDLDFNGHVNNTVFIGWALEHVPEGGVQPLLPSEIEVNYLSDIKFGQTVKAQGQILATEAWPAFLYSIVDINDNSEKTRMRIVWKPLP